MEYMRVGVLLRLGIIDRLHEVINQPIFRGIQYQERGGMRSDGGGAEIGKRVIGGEKRGCGVMLGDIDAT